MLGVIDEMRGEQTRSGWVLGLIGRELAGDGPAGPDTAGISVSPAAGLPVTYEIPSGGIESPGVACAWPTCWARNTARYGVPDPAELTRTDYAINPRNEEGCGLVLCPAHAARLGGFRYVRPTVAPRAAAKVPQTA